jgi:hypothetical protein
MGALRGWEKKRVKMDDSNITGVQRVPVKRCTTTAPYGAQTVFILPLL